MATNRNADRELSDQHRTYFQDTELFHAQIRHRAHYRPKTHDPETTKRVSPYKNPTSDKGCTTIIFDCSNEDYAYICSSLLDFTIPQLSFKPELSKTHEIRLVGDLHGVLRKSLLDIDSITLTQTTLTLDAGMTVPRSKAADYRRHCLKDSPLREWASEIPETRTCLPQTWSYCIHEHEAIPIYTGSKVKHTFTLALSLANLFEMRRRKAGAKGSKESWEVIPFDASLLAGDKPPTELPLPEFWVNYSQHSEEELEHLRKPERMMEPIEKRYIDFISISPPNPEKSGRCCGVDVKTRRDWAVLAYIYAATQFREDKKNLTAARPQESRYLTEHAEPAAHTFQLQYAETPHTEELGMELSQALQYLRADSTVLNEGIGVFSAGALGLTGTDTFTDGLSTKMAKVLVKLRKSEHKYRVRVALCCVRTLIFRKGQACSEPDSAQKTPVQQPTVRDSPISTYY